MAWCAQAISSMAKGQCACRVSMSRGRVSLPHRRTSAGAQWHGTAAGGEPWALPVLATCWVLVMVGFAVVFKRYTDAGVTLSLGDLPPLFHYPAFLVTPAIVLSWIGLR